MTTDSSTDIPEPAPQLRLASGEVVFARWRHVALEHGMVSQQLWLREQAGALTVAERPSGWNGEAAWWLAEGDRRADLLALLPRLMPSLPPGLDAPRKLQIAARMPYPGSLHGTPDWETDDPAQRPFVDAVFADDAAHLHLADVAVLEGADALPTFQRWLDALRWRQLGRHWLHHLEPGTRFHAEYSKLCWLRRELPFDGIAALVDSRGDEMPHRTMEAFWQWVGQRAASYWDERLSYTRRRSPHCLLVTDGAVPPSERLFALQPYGSVTLACVTPFVLRGVNWLRVDARGWGSALGEAVSLAPNRTCRMAGATDVGKRRTANQDALLWSQEHGWAAVADGMGGHPDGDVASATVLRVFDDAMRDWPDARTPHRRRTVAQRLRRAAAQAHAELWKTNNGAGVFQRMGTTLSALRLHGRELSLVHSGDSRIYEFTLGDSFRDQPSLRCLTTDHGEGGGLDRALGLWERVPADIDTVPIASNALYLLCTDGLTNMVTDRKILELCSQHAGGAGADSDLEGLVGALIEAANEAGGDDNITVCVVEAKERREDRAGQEGQQERE